MCFDLSLSLLWNMLFTNLNSCSCYSTKAHINSMIFIHKLNLTSLRNIYIKCSLRTTHILCICLSTKSNSIWGWGSCCLHKFPLSNNYMSSLRTTTCDALIVPSDKVCHCPKQKLTPVSQSSVNSLVDQPTSFLFSKFK